MGNRQSLPPARHQNTKPLNQPAAFSFPVLNQTLLQKKICAARDWVRITRKELENKARRTAPEVFKSAKIPAIKAKMREMGRSKDDYYPEIAARLKMRRFTSLNELSPKNLERVYQLVLRDAKRR